MLVSLSSRQRDSTAKTKSTPPTTEFVAGVSGHGSETPLVNLVVRKIAIDLTQTSYFASQTIKGRLELDGHTIDRLVKKRFDAFDDIAGNGARDHCSINFLSCAISS